LSPPTIIQAKADNSVEEIVASRAAAEHGLHGMVARIVESGMVAARIEDAPMIARLICRDQNLVDNQPYHCLKPVTVQRRQLFDRFEGV
jgi:hypothetical protein